MPYIYWQPHPLGGTAQGTITRIQSDHTTHTGWCIWIQPEYNPHLRIHIPEPLSTGIIRTVYTERLEEAQVWFVYGPRRLNHLIVSVGLEGNSGSEDEEDEDGEDEDDDDQDDDDPADEDGGREDDEDNNGVDEAVMDEDDDQQSQSNTAGARDITESLTPSLGQS